MFITYFLSAKYYERFVGTARSNKHHGKAAESDMFTLFSSEGFKKLDWINLILLLSIRMVTKQQHKVIDNQTTDLLWVC